MYNFPSKDIMNRYYEKHSPFIHCHPKKKYVWSRQQRNTLYLDIIIVIKNKHALYTYLSSLKIEQFHLDINIHTYIAAFYWFHIYIQFLLINLFMHFSMQKHITWAFSLIYAFRIFFAAFFTSTYIFLHKNLYSMFIL